MAVWSQVQGALKQQGLAPGFPEVLAAVDFLHEAGAQVSIAHPQRYPQAVSEELLARVDAVEVYHPSHSPSITDFWRSVAVRTGKQVTGGHDFHGWNKPHNLPAPLQLTDELLLST
jgi:predicted metal-dependent phosphoesterase TrpH